jgi:release factor glutamine methyltransferase
MAARSAGSVGEALSAAREALAAAGVETPRLDSELLLAAALDRDPAALHADPDAGVPAPAGRAFGAAVRRRVAREPVAYILGCKGFRRLELACDRRALIPRPETEMLVEVALELRPATVLDVGTGSGAIALAVADELDGARVTGTDPSAEALALARENRAALGLGERVELEPGSLPATGVGWDLVLANLPYVSDREWSSLAPEITRWEPPAALLGGGDGLQEIRALVAALKPAGGEAEPRLRAAAVALEVGAGQAGAVAALLEPSARAVQVRPDLAGIERVVLALGVGGAGGA